MKDIPLQQLQQEIPQGSYCYHMEKVPGSGPLPQFIPCKYWSLDKSKPDQDNGYCSYLEKGDWNEGPDGLGMLWDQVKECGINTQ